MLLNLPRFPRLPAFPLIGLALGALMGVAPQDLLAGISSLLGMLFRATQWLLVVEAELDEFHGRSLLLLVGTFVWLASSRIVCELLLYTHSHLRTSWNIVKSLRAQRYYALANSWILFLFLLVVMTAGLSRLAVTVPQAAVGANAAPYAELVFWLSALLCAALGWPKRYPSRLVRRFGVASLSRANALSPFQKVVHGTAQACTTMDLPHLVLHMVNSRASLFSKGK